MATYKLFQEQTLDKTRPIPLYDQLKNLILDMIAHNQLNAGDLLPTEQEFCHIFNISRTTVRLALSELVHEKKLYRIKGRGTFVAHNKILQNTLMAIESFHVEMKNKGYTLETHVLEFKKVKPSADIATALKLSPSNDVISLQRLHFIDRLPVVYVHTYLPYSSCQHLFDYDMTTESLYQILSKNINTKIHRVLRSAEAVIPTTADCALLDITKHTAIQLIYSTGYNQFNSPVEYTIARYRGDKNHFVVELQ